MQDILKVSDITFEDVADYIRLDSPDTDETNTINTLIRVAKEYIKRYTGLADKDLDAYSDLVIVVLTLCQDMWDNRAMYVDKSNVNRTVESILNMHAVNLL